MPVSNADLERSPLGHATGYPDTYDPTQLFAVPRAPQRATLGLTDALPFTGSDLWTAYELTWLDPRGKPCIAIATIEVPADSPSIVESKSMKLYLGSFAQSSFKNPGDVAATIKSDLMSATGAVIRVQLKDSTTFANQKLSELEGESLDALQVDCTGYEIDATTLVASGQTVAEALTTNLFRSVCPITAQPDIASVRIGYRGAAIDRAGLLRYLVSYRRHPGFHEHCVERIFVDVLARCRCESLTVYARFTRRGGIDINPFRTNEAHAIPENVRAARQ
ncbi:MAG TPA: NADPH-dependent 7-cyano-7-deazaguanine reductase QueF [Casimicrobiaceae bacterium]